MNSRVLVVVAIAALLQGCSSAPTQVPVTPGWHLYRNIKYGYEIQYPDGYEVRETGLEEERDGASIRIALYEYAALTPCLDVQVGAEAQAGTFPPFGMQPKDLEVSITDVTVGGRAAKEAAYRWKANGDLAFVFVELEGANFTFMAAPHTADLHATEWWSILSTFRFTDG